MIGLKDHGASQPGLIMGRTQTLTMFLQAKSVFVAALISLLGTFSCFAQNVPSNAFKGIQVELPSNGHVRVENQFGESRC
jgi:hypothetical protein